MAFIISGNPEALTQTVPPSDNYLSGPAPKHLDIKCIAESTGEHSVFFGGGGCKYLTIPLNRREQKTPVHLLIFKMLSSLVDSSWN